MGNIVNSNLQSDGSFAGAAHTISSSVTNITSTGVNFTGVNQTITLSGTGKTINFGSATDTSATINYYNVPTFNNSTGGYFKIGTTGFIDSSGKIASSFIPTISTLGTLSNVNTTTLTATGSITGANFYTSGTGSFYGPHIGDMTGGNVTLGSGKTLSGAGQINLTGGITGASINTTSISNSTPTMDFNLLTNMTGGTIKIGATGSVVKVETHLQVPPPYIIGATTINSSFGEVNLYASAVSNINLGNTAGTGSINLNQNISTAKTLTSTSDISGKSISSATPKFTDGGGLKIGTNKWTIAENASGNLCFYNNNGTTGTSTVPYACIQGGAVGTAGVGNLITGTA